jgi:hypothetical protein
MSTALVLSLRESCGYLRDGGYHQTAQLMAAAADEMERLDRQLASISEPLRPGTAAGPAAPRRLFRLPRGRRTASHRAGSIPRELGT